MRYRQILFTFALALLCSCGNNEIDSSIKQFARDGEIDAQEWETLVEKAQSESSLQTDGVVDPSKLKEYISTYVIEKLRGVDAVSFADNIIFSSRTVSDEASENEIIQFKFFLERSGSMTSYDSPQTSGSFKRAIAGLLNSIPGNESQRHLMYIVNDAVYNYNHTYKDFLQSSNIFNDSKNIGDPRYTDFTCIFDSILNRTEPGQMSILVSDLIYSTKNMANVNPLRILNEAQSMTTTTFKGHQNLDVVVMKFSADFIGKYYSYNDPHVGKNYNGQRPFYMMLVADHATLKKVFQNERYKDFRNFRHLLGFENYYCFTHTEGTPEYSFLINDQHNIGRFTAARTTANSKRTIHDLAKVESDRDGFTALTLAINFSDVITDQEYLTNPANYVVQSQSNFRVKSIEPITAQNRTQDIENNAPNATHIIVLNTSDNLKNEKVCVSLKNRMPTWIEASSSNDDSNLNTSDFASTTFAFKYLMQGIYESFFSTTETPEFFRISFNIEKN